MLKTPIREAVEIISGSSKVTALTGAGFSAASGIETFRGKDGLWANYDPEEYATLSAFKKNPEKVWGFFLEVYDQLKDAEPNSAHRALSEMESTGFVSTVITQNIDNLHQKAGSEEVLEFHGSYTDLKCLNCGDKTKTREMGDIESPPRCRCGNIYKPDVVFFGESIPEERVSKTITRIQGSDCLLLMGTSAVVAPISQLPYLAKKTGAKVVEFNVEHTPLTDSVTDIFINGKVENTLPLLLKALKE